MAGIDTTSPHYKGKYASIYEVNKAYPSGGATGDYVDIQGFAHYWNADRNNWLVNQERDEYWDELLLAASAAVERIDKKLTDEITAREKADEELWETINESIGDKLILQEQYMGFWDSTITYMRTRRTYPTVTHLGSKWYLVVSSDKGTEPMPNSNVWRLMQGNNDLKLKFSNNDNFIVLAKKVNTIVSLYILINDYDVTQKTLSTAYSMSWVRDSGVSADDKAWKPTFVNENGEIIQADKIEERTHLLLRQNEEVKDLGMKWNEVRTCKFIVTIELANDVSLTGEIII